ncbi:DNA translocase FtsK [Macrococcus canis]|uniref:FtsK/SpoIIIE domain-containing protein n=1 Tax=Macrococcoides canis TaxID=1855823 RepID=UPI00207C53BF|nr:FtsK/SpoIIIE domain-containing protein [Macrococcus canis]MCO4096973.1 DNA translocase FtsK [Macrococcus canis]
MKSKYPFAGISKNIYFALKTTTVITVILLVLGLILSILSKWIIKAAEFLFEPNYAHNWFIETNAKNDGAMSKLPFVEKIFADTSNWSENIASAISLESGTLISSILKTALIVFTILLVLYIITIVLRHHKGEIEPFLNDRESFKLKRQIISSLGAGVRDIYDESDRKLKKKEHGARFAIRRMQVEIHTTLDKGQPRPTKKYSVTIRKPRKTEINRMVLTKIRDLHDILTDLTDGVSFDQMKTTANRRYYVYEGAEEKELKEARSVIKRRERYNNRNSNGLVLNEGQTLKTTFPLEVINDVSEKVETEKRRATEFAESIKESVRDQLSTIDLQANLSEIFLTSRTAVFTYSYRYNPNQPDDRKIAKSISDRLRIEGVIATSGAGTLDIEVPFPNDSKKPSYIAIPVDYRSMLEKMVQEVKGINDTSTIIGVLKDGTPRVKMISEAPHLSVVGATGSGKSVALNSLLISLLAHKTPDEVKVMIVDPKLVEFTMYENSPYMITNPITDVKDAEIALEYAVIEMEKRYDKLRKLKLRNIKDYNKLAETDTSLEKMTYWVVLIDEFAEFKKKSEDFKAVEDLIQRLCQAGRACGLSLILATQTPRAEVITGIIKANLPTKIAFRTSNRLESTIALDDTSEFMTANNLLGKGDGIIQDETGIMRFQGVYISDEEIESITTYWRENFDKPVFADYKAVVARAHGNEMSDETVEQYSAMTSLQQTRLDNNASESSYPVKKTALEKAQERQEKKERTYKVDMSKYFKDVPLIKTERSNSTNTQSQPEDKPKADNKSVEKHRDSDKEKSTSDILGL